MNAGSDKPSKCCCCTNKLGKGTGELTRIKRVQYKGKAKIRSDNGKRESIITILLSLIQPFQGLND
jgi:hypothetical protein